MQRFWWWFLWYSKQEWLGMQIRVRYCYFTSAFDLYTLLARSACFQKNAGLCWESFLVTGSWPVTNSLTCTHNACFQGNAGLCWNAPLFPWKFFSGWKLISHNVCMFFREMLDFADKVRRWMAADQSNVIAIHCKGGKGRTGTMICVWLIECGLFEGAKVMTLQWTLFFLSLFF